MPTSKAAPAKNPHRGSTFDSFLAEEGILEEVEAVARRMSTYRAQLDRLLDPKTPASSSGARSG